MNRTKRNAAMFLLGAVIVGGVVDRSAAQLVSGTRQAADQARRIDRNGFFDDLDLTAAQRTAWTQVADSTNCQILQLNAPLKPKMDSIRDRSRARLWAVLTPAQQAKLKTRARDDSLRRASSRPPGTPPDRNPCGAKVALR